MEPQHFHRFADLPRELQLQIWKIHERDNFVHVQHYFRRMRVWNGRLYEAADLDTGKSVEEHLPAMVSIGSKIRPFLAPRNDILLPGGRHWRSAESWPTLSTFMMIQAQMPAPSNHFTQGNFKYDNFCFASSENNNGDILDYFAARQDEGAVFPQDSLWFFRIQHMTLAPCMRRPRLSPFDRWLLANHPSLKTITVVTEPTSSDSMLNQRKVLPISHHAAETPSRTRPTPLLYTRISVEEYLSLAHAIEALDCEDIEQRVKWLETLKQELLRMFHERERMRPLTVRLEVEVRSDYRECIRNVLGNKYELRHGLWTENAD